MISDKIISYVRARARISDETRDEKKQPNLLFNRVRTCASFFFFFNFVFFDVRFVSKVLVCIQDANTHTQRETRERLRALPTQCNFSPSQLIIQHSQKYSLARSLVHELLLPATALHLPAYISYTSLVSSHGGGGARGLIRDGQDEWRKKSTRATNDRGALT